MNTEPNEPRSRKLQSESQAARIVQLARRTSLIDRLVKESDALMQNQFDREEVRRRVVPLYSIFKDKATLRKALFDKQSLFNKISGRGDDF